MNQYIGQRLGAYQILEQIGQGGMATIFKAYQPSMDRYVAVKILPSHFTEDESFVARFTQEARMLARLEHPHILPVHDYGEQEGITYLVMRYIDAGTLKDLITQQGPLSLDEVARILDQIGRALGHAHSQGVVHRDIKPANVLVDERGDVFLTDFGIAKLVVGTAHFTATGAIVGTPAYMSPEQGLGETVDHRSDIYALGVVLYEMVVSRVPFEAETPLAVLLKHINAPLPPPRQIKPDLPEAVERVILKAMAKTPDDRFQAAEEMVEAFQKAMSGLPTEFAIPIPSAGVADVTIPAKTVGAAPAPIEPAAAVPIHKTIPFRPSTLGLSSGRRLKTKPWLPIAGGVAALAVLLVAALLILPNLGGEKAKATSTTVLVVAQATSTPSTAVEPAATPTLPSTAIPLPPGQAAPSLPPGWTNYSNGNFVRALARQDDYLWVGSEGGLLRWDLNDGSYVQFSVADGLVSNWVNDLLVDENEDLWVATDEGLSRFDGETWLIFDEADGLDTNEVLSLFMDDDGALWAGTAYGERGLNYYAGSGWGPPPIPPLPLDFPMPRAFAGSDEVGLFVGLNERGLAHFDGDGWQVLTSDDGLPGDQVIDLLLTDDDELWISFEYETVRLAPGTGDWETVPNLDGIGVYNMHQAGDGSLWFAGDGGATCYDPLTGDWQRFESGNQKIPSWAVSAIIEDDDGLWLGTYDNGVVFYDGSTWEHWATDDGLGGNYVDAIIQDGNGAVWFVHSGNGLSRYDQTSDTWQTFAANEGAFDWPSFPGVDSAGHVWIGEYGELKRYDGRVWQSFTPPELADVAIYVIAFAPDDVQWLLTDSGLMRHDPATDEWTTFTAANHSALQNMNVLYVARDGALWVGSEMGLSRYSELGWSEPVASGDPPEYVSDIAAAPDGSLWVVADGDLYHLDDGRWIHSSWPGGDWIERLAIGPDGIVWAGYDGLGRFDPTDNDWQFFTPEDGLVHPGVQAIHVTAAGVVWVGTESGVSRYVPGTGPEPGLEENPIVWSFVPSGETGRVTAGAQSIVDMLHDETGLFFEIHVATEYAGAIKAMCADPPEAQMSSLATFTYIMAAERGCAEAALVSIRFGAPVYNGQIIARADSGITDISDLAGKTFCRPGPLSVSGWIIPMLTMRAAGLVPETDLAEIVETASHDIVVAAVYGGYCDAGATYVDARPRLEEEYPDVMEQVIVVEATVDIPNDGVQFAPSMPQELRDKIVRGLLAIAETEKGRQALGDAFGWDGLEEHDDTSYDPFREMLRTADFKVEDLLQR